MLERRCNMGDFTEAVIEGIFCCECGELVDGTETGFPRPCEECKE